MGDHLVLDVNRPIKSSADMAAPSSSETASLIADENGASYDEEAPLLTMAECRICQEEDSIDALETPCSCNGSLKYAHRKCVQHWCDEKGDITCEICHQPYQPGYVAPPPRPCMEETTIDIGGAWQISEADRQYLEAEYDDYNSTNASGAAFCRSAVLILMALLLLRHASSVPDSDGDGDGDEDASTFLSLFLLRVAGFLLPCYIMIWAINILQRRRQRQQEAALAAAQFAFVLQAGQRRGLQVTVASLGPTPPPAPAQAPAPTVTPTTAPQDENV